MTDVMEPVLLSSWPRDDLRDEELTLEQELEKLRAEKRALQMRVLGVDELARLLQDRTSELRITEEKNKRLEVAVVRLENRCSNFEKKLKSQNAAPPRSGQMPLIPGPSRQILDSLMKENAELKKVINKHTSKGPTSYLEAVVSALMEGRDKIKGRRAHVRAGEESLSVSCVKARVSLRAMLSLSIIVLSTVV